MHESTHAIFDINDMDMKVKESEAGAYIAQSMFFYYLNEQAIRGGATPTFQNPILRAAWPIARPPRAHRTFLSESARLYAAIANSHQYGGQAEDDIDYDGA